MRGTPGGRFGLALFLVFGVLPIASGLVYAALYSIGAVGLLSRGTTAEHWRRVLFGGEFGPSLVLSAGVAVAATALATAAAVTLALVFRERLRSGPLAALLHVPLAIPAVAGAFLGFQLLSGSGLLSRVLVHAGLLANAGRMPSLVQDRLGIGVVLVEAALAAPFLTLLFAQLDASERLEDLAEVAASLGATRRQSILAVELPVLLRAGLFNVLLVGISVFGAFEVPLVLGSQSPQMLSVLTFRKSGLYDLSRRPEAFAIALLYSGIVVAALAAALRLRRDHDAA